MEVIFKFLSKNAKRNIINKIYAKSNFSKIFLIGLKFFVTLMEIDVFFLKLVLKIFSRIVHYISITFFS